MIHVRFEGRSYDLDTGCLGLSESLSDREIKASLAGYFDAAVDRFDDYVVDRRPSGGIVVRPEAVYG